MRDILRSRRVTPKVTPATIIVIYSQTFSTTQVEQSSNCLKHHQVKSPHFCKLSLNTLSTKNYVNLLIDMKVTGLYSLIISIYVDKDYARKKKTGGCKRSVSKYFDRGQPTLKND